MATRILSLDINPHGLRSEDGRGLRLLTIYGPSPDIAQADDWFTQDLTEAMQPTSLAAKQKRKS